MVPKHGSPHTTHKLLTIIQHPQQPSHHHIVQHALPPSPQPTHIDISPVEIIRDMTPSQITPMTDVDGLTPSVPSVIHTFPDIPEQRRSPSHANGNGNGVIHPPERLVDPVPPIRILCFNLSGLPRPVIFIGLSTGVCFFFLANSYVEEYLFRELPKFQYGWYMTFFELMCFATFAAIERLGGNDDTCTSIWSHRASYDKHFLVAVVMTLSRGLTNQSLQFLNYPTQVIFKSMKLLTVMIGAVLVLKKVYTLWEYVAALLLVISAILFSLGDSEITPNFHVFGVILVLISLIFDAAHSTTQETLMTKHGASTLEAMLFTNAFAGMCALCVVVISGELLPALTFCNQYPQSYYLFCFRALFVYFGVLCFITLIQTHGVVPATVVTTVRKILTILLSFYNFPKPWVAKYFYGLGCFVIAIGLSAWNDIQTKKRAAEEKRRQESSHGHGIRHNREKRDGMEDIALLHRNNAQHAQNQIQIMEKH